MKDETFGAYKAFTAWAKSQHGTQIKQLCSDHSGKFTGHDFTNLLFESRGLCNISQRTTCHSITAPATVQPALVPTTPQPQAHLLAASMATQTQL